MKHLAILAFLSASAGAQVTVRFTPEPMVVPASQLATARDLGRWTVIACNDGPATVSLPSERIDLAAGNIRLIDADDALLVLTAAQKRTVAATVAKYGTTAAQIVALGLAVASRANLPTSAALSLGSAFLPQLAGIAQDQVPSVAPLTSSVKYPVVLEPGGCFTDHRFAGKMKSPQIVIARIVLPAFPVASVTVPAPTPHPTASFEIPRDPFVVLGF